MGFTVPPFFTILGTLLLLMRLLMFTLTSLLLRLSINLLGLFQSSTPMKGGKAKHEARFWLHVKKRPFQDSCGGPLAKKPHLETIISTPQDSTKSNGHVSGSSAISIKNGNHGG